MNQTYYADVVIARGQTRPIQLIAQVQGLCSVPNGGQSNVMWTKQPANIPVQLTNQSTSCTPNATLQADVPSGANDPAWYIVATLPRPDGKVDVVNYRIRQRLAPRVTAPTSPIDTNGTDQNFCLYTTQNAGATSGLNMNFDGPKMRFYKTGSNVYFQDGARFCNSPAYFGTPTEIFSRNRLLDYVITVQDPSPYGSSLDDFTFTGSCHSTALPGTNNPAFASSGAGCENYCPFDFQFLPGPQANQKRVIVSFKQNGIVTLPGHTFGSPYINIQTPTQHFNIAGGQCWYDSSEDYTPIHISVTVRSAGGALSSGSKEIAQLKVEVN